MSILSRPTFLALLLLGCFLYAQETLAAVDQVGDFEVIAYREPHFVGASMSWRLEPGMRQRLVQSVGRDWKEHNSKPGELLPFGGLIGSMKVGAQIGVYVFERLDFCSTSTDLRSGRFKFGPGLHENLEIWKGKIRSMILYRLKDREPFGALLMANPLEVTVSKEFFMVFPVKERRVRLPERIQFLPISQPDRDHQRIYRNLGDFMGDRAVSIQMYGREVKVELYRNSELEGKSLILPGQGSQETRFDLSTFHFQNDVSSARVFLDLPTSDQGGRSAPSSVRKEAPPASSGQAGQSAPSRARVEAPPASSDQKQRSAPSKVTTEAPPASSDTGQPGAKQAMPQTTRQPIQIAGSWKRSAGGLAEVSQDGEQFTWLLDGMSGIGRIEGSNVHVTWDSPQGEKNMPGKITHMDPRNRAIRIDWDNGQSWTREAR